MKQPWDFESEAAALVGGGRIAAAPRPGSAISAGAGKEEEEDVRET